MWRRLRRLCTAEVGLTPRVRRMKSMFFKSSREFNWSRMGWLRDGWDATTTPAAVPGRLPSSCRSSSEKRDTVARYALDVEGGRFRLIIILLFILLSWQWWCWRSCGCAVPALPPPVLGRALRCAAATAATAAVVAGLRAPAAV